MSTVGGIILCGGQSSRMGRSKAWLTFGNETLLQRVVRVLSEVAHPIVVVAAPEQELPLLPTELLVARDQEKGRGPLQGLAAGLKALQNRCESAYLSGCDVPFLNTSFIKLMIELLGHHSICVPRIESLYHPLAAVYRMNVLNVVDKHLEQNRLKMTNLFDELPTRCVGSAELAAVDPSLQSLRNLNTSEEYMAALQEAGFKRDGTAGPNHGA